MANLLPRILIIWIPISLPCKSVSPLDIEISVSLLSKRYLSVYNGFLVCGEVIVFHGTEGAETTCCFQIKGIPASYYHSYSYG